MLTAALAYARRGIPVLPLHHPTPGVAPGCSCGQPGCDRPGKHPRLRHGLSDASTDPCRLDGWWRRWPDANIGLCTGVVMDVADVDTDEGRHALAHLLGELPAAPLVRSGGGWHLWFAPTGHGNRVRLLPGVDWRGAGGYVVAPPSRHARGTAYTWLHPPATRPDRPLSLPACPAALRRLIAGPPPAATASAPHVARPDRYAQAALDAEAARVAHAPVGARNDTLNRAAFALGRLVGAGLLDEPTVRHELTTAARYAGLGRDETLRTIRSGLAAGRRRPSAAGRAA
jgi:hypothetical protein